MSVVAFDRHGLGELRAEIGVWPKLTEKGLAQRLSIFRRFWVWLLDLRGAASDRRARQFHRRLGGKAEGDEEGRVIDIHIHRLAVGILRLLERQREVEREQALVVVERIILRRLQRKIVAVPDMDEGEIIELL